MVQHKRVRAIAIEPPCTSFSPAARPAVRSYKEPRGFCQENPKILGRKQAGIQRPSSALGRTLCRGFWTSGDTQEVKNGMAPRVALPPDPCGHKEVSTASCAFGSIHQKEFRFLTCNMVPDSVSRRCRRDHHHVKIEGQITKGKAVYCPGLVRALGSLRAGGATYLQMLLEDSELTRRRGRWLSGRTMEIYPHESSATTYFPQLPPETKKRIMQAANSFATMLKKVICFTKNYIKTISLLRLPPVFLIAAKTDEQQTGKEGRHDRKMGAMDANSTHGRFCGAEWTERSIPEAKKRVVEQLDIVEKASDVLPSPSQASPKNPPTQEA